VVPDHQDDRATLALYHADPIAVVAGRLRAERKSLSLRTGEMVHGRLLSDEDHWPRLVPPYVAVSPAYPCSPLHLLNQHHGCPESKRAIGYGDDCRRTEVDHRGPPPPFSPILCFLFSKAHTRSMPAYRQASPMYR